MRINLGNLFRGKDFGEYANINSLFIFLALRKLASLILAKLAMLLFYMMNIIQNNELHLPYYL